MMRKPREKAPTQTGRGFCFHPAVSDSAGCQPRHAETTTCLDRCAPGATDHPESCCGRCEPRPEACGQPLPECSMGCPLLIYLDNPALEIQFGRSYSYSPVSSLKRTPVSSGHPHTSEPSGRRTGTAPSHGASCPSTTGSPECISYLVLVS